MRLGFSVMARLSCDLGVVGAEGFAPSNAVAGGPVVDVTPGLIEGGALGAAALDVLHGDGDVRELGAERGAAGGGGKSQERLISFEQRVAAVRPSGGPDRGGVGGAGVPLRRLWRTRGLL